MSFDKVKAYLTNRGFGERIQEFDVSSATVDLAAAALGCDGQRIAKSLTFAVDGGAVMVVAAGDVKVDNAKYKAFFATKAKMLSAQEVETMVGHKVGGVCPFALYDGVKVYLDESLKRFKTVYPACGSANSAIELTIDELESLSGYIAWIDVCKIKNDIK